MLNCHIESDTKDSCEYTRCLPDIQAQIISSWLASVGFRAGGGGNRPGNIEQLAFLRCREMGSPHTEREEEGRQCAQRYSAGDKENEVLGNH